MGRIRVLHLCNWLPNRLRPSEAPFVHRHIEALAPHVDQEVWHIAVEPGHRWRAAFRGPHAHRTLLFHVPLRRWRLIEWSTHLLVLLAWATRARNKRWDVVNLHIAYPLGVRTRSLLRLFRAPVVITEHWSAYHYSFGTRSPGLDRIRAIFGHGLPLITVSHALLQDIEQFSGHAQADTLVVDNVVEQDHYRPVPGVGPEPGRLLAVGGWRFPKRPDVLLALAERLHEQGRPFELRLVGDGPMLADMRSRVEQAGLARQVTFLGRLEPAALAAEMGRAHLFLHASDYETYSVVCAEALCTGTPVLASNVGGIVEYLDKESGALVRDDRVETWLSALDDLWDRALNMDRQGIAHRARGRTSAAEVGARYAAFLRSQAGPDAPHRTGGNNTHGHGT